MIDLHIHSNYSDGELSVLQIIELSKAQNLKSIAITDHYSLNAHFENNINDIELVAGIELSVKIIDTSVHLIGLLFDINDLDLNKMIKRIHLMRYKNMINLRLELNKNGVFTHNIPKNYRMSQYIDELFKNNENIPRKHLENMIYNSKYYKKYKEQIDIEPKEAIDLIHNAHGVVIIPHINMIPLEKRENIIRKLIKYGIDGIETIYPTYSADDKTYAKNICKKYNLLESGGSDFHGKLRKENVIGFNSIPNILLEKMKEKRNNA